MHREFSNGPHGGRLRAAAARYGIAVSEWIDLSTGIAPFAWQVPALPADCWRRLPEEGPHGDGLEEIARAHYGAPHVLPVAGSQAAILTLPRLREASRVIVAQGSYAEHAYAWAMAGHSVRAHPIARFGDVLDDADVMIVVRPDNPTGQCLPTTTLLAWHARLASRGGWLIVDEAFIDADDAHSLAPYCERPGLIVLRSLGKFFGLAGARVGFVCATGLLLARLASLVGPWTVSSPSRLIAREALADTAWQQEQRERLALASSYLAQVLTEHGLAPDGGTSLFQWVRTAHAACIADALARQGVLVRHFGEPAALRFGLPGSLTDWSRLRTVLASAQEACQWAR
ncbi:MAG: threonine-phosphate decarboxylase CobD [Rhodocyclaceae bacterium]